MKILAFGIILLFQIGGFWVEPSNHHVITAILLLAVIIYND
jgi:hypothetical protein